MILTIITVTYNDRAGLLKTFDSIKEFLANYITQVEWIVIDGGSTDFWSYAPTKVDNIKIISESDAGIYDAMNKGLEHSNGEGILFLNSGDFLEGDLSLLLNKYPIIFQSLYGYSNRFKRKFLPRFLGLPTSHQAIVFKKNNIKYDTKYKICADYDYFMKSVTNYTITTGLVAIIEESGISSRFKWDQIKEAYLIQRKYYLILPEIIFLVRLIKNLPMILNIKK